MGVLKRNDLSRYLRKMQKYEGKFNEDTIKGIVGNIGVKTVKKYITDPTIKIGSEETNDGVMIYANGEKLPFIEFGTGIRGDGKYLGNLPPKDMVLEFESAGRTQHTEGWEYNYRKKQKQTTKDWIGNEPQAPMYKSARELEEGALAKGVKDSITEKPKPIKED